MLIHQAEVNDLTSNPHTPVSSLAKLHGISVWITLKKKHIHDVLIISLPYLFYLKCVLLQPVAAICTLGHRTFFKPVTHHY